MQLLRRLSFTMLMMSLMTLVGCGGGDGGDLTGGGGGGTDPDPTVIALTKSEGDLSGTNDVTITATVMEGTSAVANKLVTFTLSDDTLATFSPTSGTAVTNASGVATIVVKATSVAGGLDVTATVEDVDPVSIGLTSAGGGTGGGDPDLVSLSLSKTEGDLSGENDITVTASVTQGTTALANQLITFTLSDDSLAILAPQSGTAVTDESGMASILVKATNLSGGVEVTATMEDITPVSIGFNSIGGGSGGVDQVAVALVISNNEVSATNPSTITATITQGDAPLAGKLIQFTLDNEDLASFLPATGTASSNDDGIATIDITAGSTGGAGLITASVDGQNLATITYTSLGDGNDGGTPDVATITLFASSQQLASSAAQEITLTAIAKDANNNLLANVPVSFSADSGSLAKITDDSGQSSNKTGPDGRVSMTLSTPAEPSNRIITTTVTSGSVSDSLEVQVVGTTVTLTGSSSLALNDENSFIIKLLDSDGNGLANRPVALSLSNESTEEPAGDIANITIPDSVTTDFNGQATVAVTGTSGGTNSIIASALGATTRQAVRVQADSFLFSNFIECNDADPEECSQDIDPNSASVPDILLSKKAKVTLTWLRGGQPVADGTEVGFTTTRGTLDENSATTVDGKVTAIITSTNAGKALLTFTGTDTVDDKAIELNNQIEFEFVADTADRLIAQAFPVSIGPNDQTSTISVVVRDPEGNLVKNKTVDFVLTDTNGGSIFPASAVTDSTGSASTVYTSTNTSAQDGVSIKATVRDTSVTDTVTLTVADREVFITLGTGNSIENVDETTYNKKYSVFVTDIDSNPVPNVALTVSAVPRTYAKGYWEAVLEDGEFDHYAAVHTARCPNEDVDNDGVYTDAEDTNGDGKLTPGNVVNASGQVTTDEQGRAIIDITYAEVYGHWIYIDLVASTKVNGTESFANTLFILPVSGEDVTDEGNPPASFLGGLGPFGTAAICSDPN